MNRDREIAPADLNRMIRKLMDERPGVETRVVEAVMGDASDSEVADMRDRHFGGDVSLAYDWARLTVGTSGD